MTLNAFKSPMNAFKEHLILHPLLDLTEHIKVSEVLNGKVKFFNPEFPKLLDHRMSCAPSLRPARIKHGLGKIKV